MNQADKTLLYSFLKRHFNKLDSVTTNYMNKFEFSELLRQLDDDYIDKILPPTKYIQAPKIEVYQLSSAALVLERLFNIPQRLTEHVGRFLALLNIDYLNENASYLKMIRIRYQIPKKAVDEALKYKLFERAVHNFKENIYYLNFFVQQCMLVGLYIVLYEQCDDSTIYLLDILIGSDEEAAQVASQKLVYGLREMSFELNAYTIEMVELLYSKLIIGQLVGEPELDSYIQRQKFKYLYNEAIVSTACILSIENLLTYPDLQRYVTTLRQQFCIREDCIVYLREQLRPIISNYIEYFAESQDNFELFLMLYQYLHCNINKKGNFNYQLEKIIVQSFIKQFYHMTADLNFSTPKRANIDNFVDFVGKYQYEVDCQLKIFLPELDKFYCSDCFIDLNRKVMGENAYILNELRFPGTSNAEFTSIEGLTVSVYSVYIGAVILTFSDCINLIASKWFIEGGRLYRINISYFKSCAQVIYTLIASLYDQLVREYGEEQRELINQFIEADCIIYLCNPLTKCVINSEFDYCKYILDKAVYSEQIVQISDGSQDYQCSSLVVDATQLLATILREIIGNMNFTKYGIHVIFSGFSDIVVRICELLNIDYNLSCYEQVENLFDHKSAKARFYKVNLPSIDLFATQIASPDVSMSFYTSQQATEQYFADVNSKFEKFQPRRNRSEVFSQFVSNEPGKNMQDCFDAVDYFVFRANAMQKLREDFRTLFQQLDEYPVINVQLCDRLAPIFRNGAAQHKTDASYHCDEYLERVQRQIADRIVFLEAALASYICISFGAQVKQIYSPTPQTCSCSVILLQFRQILTYIRQDASLEIRHYAILEICRKFAAIHLLIVLDSSHRARTIAKSDFPVLSQDFREIIDVMKKFLPDKDVEELMGYNLRFLKLHSLDTTDLIAKCRVDGKTIARYGERKNIAYVSDSEAALRVLNFRRYCDDEARRFMQGVKKQLE